MIGNPTVNGRRPGGGRKGKKQAFEKYGRTPKRVCGFFWEGGKEGGGPGKKKKKKKPGNGIKKKILPTDPQLSMVAAR